MNRLTRRDWLMTASAAGLAFLTTNADAKARLSPLFFARHGLPLGVQLFAVDADLNANFDATLAKLRAIGVSSVELAGYHGRTAEQIRASLDRAGLYCTSAHIQATSIGSGPSLDGDLDAIARDMRTIGVTRIVLPIPPLPVRPTSKEDFIRIASSMTLSDWHKAAEYLNDMAKKLRRRDLGLSYHNHNFEFAPHRGGIGMDLLLRETDSSLVSFEMDVGWVVAGGGDPVALLRAHPPRFTQMHVKDVKPSTTVNYAFRQDPTEVGSGKIDWPAILPVAYAAGVREFYVEQEPPYRAPPMALIAKSAAYLLALRVP